MGGYVRFRPKADFRFNDKRLVIVKQSEMDRELRDLRKSRAKARGWKSVSNVSYWTSGPLFFSFVSSAGAKTGSFHCSLRFKWLELDRALWRVLDMEANEKEPFSLHANGAFVLTGQEIFSSAAQGLDWQPGVLADHLDRAMERASVRASEIAGAVTSLDTYLVLLDQEHESFMRRYPKAVVNIWKERLLACLLVGDTAKAADIAWSRIAARDNGGFTSNGKSFFELSLSICEAGEVPTPL